MDDQIITLKSYQSYIEALNDLDVLQANNIESRINNKQLVELYPMFNNINEGLKIVVFRKDFEIALKLLEEIHK